MGRWIPSGCGLPSAEGSAEAKNAALRGIGSTECDPRGAAAFVYAFSIPGKIYPQSSGLLFAAPIGSFSGMQDPRPYLLNPAFLIPDPGQHLRRATQKVRIVYRAARCI